MIVCLRSLPRNPRVAQTSVCDVCDMLIPLEAEVESSHAPAAAFLRPQSSSLRDHQHPAGGSAPPAGFPHGSREGRLRWTNCFWGLT